MDFNSSLVSQRIRECRKNVGYSQERLAEELGAKRTNITNYEAGRTSPTIKTIVAMTEIFEVSSDYLLGISDLKNKSIDTSKSELVRESQELKKSLNTIKTIVVNDVLPELN